MPVQVSIIIVNYNTFEFISKCIQSIYDKTLSGLSIEIIIVDNASTECNIDLLKEKYPEINLIKNTINSGFAGGNNKGLQFATGEYILLLNSDTELLNDAISISYTKMKQEGIRVAGCKTYNYDGSLQQTCEMFPSIKNSLYTLLGLNRIFNIFRFKKLQLKYTYKQDFYPDWIWGSFFFFKKDILQLFDEHKLPDIFFMYGEDMLWCFKLKQKNIQTKYYLEPSIKHHFSGNKISKDVDVNPSFRNSVIFLKQNYSPFVYKTIFILDILSDITRLKWKGIPKKYKYYTL